MDARDFLRRAVGTEGDYCLFVLKRDASGEVIKKIQRFFDNLEELQEQAERYDARGFDTYFGLATFKPGTTNRYANLALQMRALFLDLDCGEIKANPPDGGPPKGYIDQETALKALRGFCKGYGLPRPLVVNSGRGVHVYWTLDKPALAHEWEPVARALKVACESRGLLADPAVTADAARILRIPGTHNYKADPPEQVEVWSGADDAAPVSLADMAELLDAGPPKLRPSPGASSVMERMSAVQQQLSKNLTSSFKRIVVRTMADDGCAQIGEMIRRPASVDEPTWRAGLSIAAHCSDADKAIHAISKGHPEYDPEEAEEKARRIKGPYTCVKFDEYRPGICEGCPHWGNIKSPIVLGKELSTAPEEPVTMEVLDRDTGIVKEYEIPTLPKPYKRGVNGGIYKVVEDEEGEDFVLVYSRDLYVVRRVFDYSDNVESVLMRLHLPKDGVREFTVPLKSIHSTQTLMAELANHGVAARGTKQWDAIGYYIVDWINELQETASATMARRQFGWTEDMGSFLLGDRDYVVGGVVRNNAPTPATQSYMSAFRPKGTLDEWKELIEAYNQPGLEVYQLVMAASFGSALMAFYPDAGLTVHLNGSTGYGKSTLQLAAMSVWGSPEVLAMADKDTDNSKYLRMEMMKNLPVVFDEMTNTPPVSVSDLLYAVTQGRQKNRMTSGANAERTRGEAWSLIAISSGNASFYDKLDVIKVDNEAEKVRVLELRMDRLVPKGVRPFAKNFEKRIKRECYGRAGDEFIKYVVNHQSEVYEMLMQVQAKLVDRTNMEDKDRFLRTGLTCTMTAALIAKRLGLVGFDTKVLFDFAVKLVEKRQAELAGAKQTPDDILTAYMTENTDRILRINSTQRKGAEGDHELVVPDAVARGEMVARYEPDKKLVYLLPRPLRKWCSDRQINYEGFLNELAEVRTVKRNQRVRLERGTSMEPLAGRVTVVQLDDDDYESAEE